MKQSQYNIGSNYFFKIMFVINTFDKNITSKQKLSSFKKMINYN